jgi:cyanate permease
MTVGFGIIAVVLTPNFPEKAQKWFLKDHERQYLIAKLEASRGHEEKGSTADDVSTLKVLVDWRIHLFTMCFFCCDITASSISAFMTSILRELGWTSSRAQLITMPVWGAGIVFTFLVAWTAARTNFRLPFVLGSICSQLVGWSIMVAYVEAPGVRYAALFFMSIGTFPQMPLLMSWLSNNLRGRKYLAVGMAWQVGFGNCANFVSSNVFIAAQAPRYRTGFVNGLAWTCTGFVLVCCTTGILVMKNKRRAARMSTMSAEEKEYEDQKTFKFLL